MFEWWNSLQTIQQLFYIIAIPATLVLVLQTILLLFGLGHGGDADADHDFDHDLDHDVGHGIDHDADQGFTHDQDLDHDADHMGGLRLLTVRGIVAFLAVCGWVGIALLDLGVPSYLAVVVALACGLGAMFLVALLLRYFLRLQESGNLDLKNAVGVVGEVYVPIPDGGKGKVTLVVQERFMELDAICPGGELATGRQVRVTGVTDSDILIVTPV